MVVSTGPLEGAGTPVQEYMVLWICIRVEKFQGPDVGRFTSISMLSRLPFHPRAILLKLMQSVAPVLVYWRALKCLVGGIACLG